MQEACSMIMKGTGEENPVGLLQKTYDVHSLMIKELSQPCARRHGQVLAC